MLWWWIKKILNIPERFVGRSIAILVCLFSSPKKRLHKKLLEKQSDQENTFIKKMHKPLAIFQFQIKKTHTYNNTSKKIVKLITLDLDLENKMNPRNQTPIDGGCVTFKNNCKHENCRGGWDLDTWADRLIDCMNEKHSSFSNICSVALKPSANQTPFKTDSPRLIKPEPHTFHRTPHPGVALHLTESDIMPFRMLFSAIKRLLNNCMISAVSWMKLFFYVLLALHVERYMNQSDLLHQTLCDQNQYLHIRIPIWNLF